jgi:hypothetical protein
MGTSCVLGYKVIVNQFKALASFPNCIFCDQWLQGYNHKALGFMVTRVTKVRMFTVVTRVTVVTIKGLKGTSFISLSIFG